mmetsp:Transcript_23452/g.69073  ORF Transcript_23452/g.69073 Transcript_23452/m.69073 type:complete len:249 (+) Transcript_23452:707-1453(+)
MSSPASASTRVKRRCAAGSSATFLIAAMTLRWVKASAPDRMRVSASTSTAEAVAWNFPLRAMVIPMMQPTARRSSSTSAHAPPAAVPAAPASSGSRSAAAVPAAYTGPYASRWARDGTRSTLIAASLPRGELLKLNMSWRLAMRSGRLPSSPRCITRCTRAMASEAKAVSMPTSTRARLARATSDASTVPSSSSSKASTSAVTILSPETRAQPSRELDMDLRARAAAVRTLEDLSLRRCVMEGTMLCS